MAFNFLKYFVLYGIYVFIQMQLFVDVVSSGDPLSALRFDCDAELMTEFYGPGALDHLPMDLLQQDLCKPNITNIIYQEVLVTYAAPFTSVTRGTVYLY